MDQSAKIYVAGHRGLAGSAIFRTLQAKGYSKIITRTHQELDLERESLVFSFFAKEKPDIVVLAAAKVGGIHSNQSYPAQFIYQNLQVQNNVIEASRKFGVKKLLFLGSSCIYPRLAPQPLKEEYLLSGPLEPTNQPYAVAKIAGIEMCQAYRKQYGCNFICVMPTNLFGYHDNFNLENSHVLPALIHKVHLAKVNREKQVVIWGSGEPYREFMFADDLGEASLFLLKNYDSAEILNVGMGEDISIKSLALLINQVVGFEGKLVFDSSKPDGSPRKLLDSRKINRLGWQPKYTLRQGIELTYQWFCLNYANMDRKKK